MITWVQDDGGRAAAGFRGDAHDCVNRAIAIATGLPYKDVRGLIHETAGRACANTGVDGKVTRSVMAQLGWLWVPTMGIGTGCRVHLHREELPTGRLVCQVSKHVVAVIDHVIHDTHDPSRGGTRCVYGYWQPPGA